MSFPLSTFQIACLGTIRGLAKDLPWLPASYVMAHVRIESGWEPAVVSSDGRGSVGLMQVLPATAKEMGFDPAGQADPEQSLAAGIAYLAWLRRELMEAWGFKETILYRPICVAYNEGPGNVLRGRKDERYWLKWAAAQQGYAFVDMA